MQHKMTGIIMSNKKVCSFCGSTYYNKNNRTVFKNYNLCDRCSMNATKILNSGQEVYL